MLSNLLHDILPTYFNLKRRGISVATTCPLCDEEEETTTHLFLLCPFTRACWHGSTLAICSLDYNNTSLQQWSSLILNKHNFKDPTLMYYLKSLFTTLWTIWNHRNKVVHEGITSTWNYLVKNSRLSILGKILYHKYFT